MSEHIEEHSRRYNTLVTIASASAIASTGILIILKIYAWIETGSTSVMVSMVDSSIDALSSTINFIVLRYALAPADEEHRFGHGKAESIAALGQAAFIFGSAGFVMLNAFERLLHPKAIEHANLGMGIIAFSIVITLALVTLQKWVIRKTGSQAIEGDSLHYSSDLLMNLAVIGGLFLASQGFLHADPIIAILVALYILFSAYRLATKAIHSLLDRELDLETQQEIGNIAFEHEEVLGLHDLRTRDGGKTIFIQMHVEMPDKIPLIDAHNVCDEIEDEILRRFPNADIIIHLDPVSAVDEEIIVPFEPIPEESESTA